MIEWGGYYQTVKECLNPEENILDFDDVFRHILNLENASTMKDVIRILQEISDEDQNKLNSPFLDSLKKYSFSKAVVNGDANLVKFYISKGVQSITGKFFIIAVELSDKENYFSIVEMLLKLDGKKLVSYQNGKALRVAAQLGFFNTAKLLLENGAIIRDNNYDAIVNAIFSYSVDIVVLFFNHEKMRGTPYDAEDIYECMKEIKKFL